MTYSFTDHNGRKVNRANVVKVFKKPEESPELKGAECMVMSVSRNDVVMLSVEKAPKNVETKRIVYVKTENLEYLRDKP